MPSNQLPDQLSFFPIEVLYLNKSSANLYIKPFITFSGKQDDTEDNYFVGFSGCVNKLRMSYQIFNKW